MWKMALLLSVSRFAYKLLEMIKFSELKYYITCFCALFRNCAQFYEELLTRKPVIMILTRPKIS